MLCLFGFLAAVVLYGAVMNTASVLLWSHSLQWELIAAACAAGLPMDLLHGGEHSPAPVPAGRPGARQAGPDAGEVWMGPRVNGEWAMETKQTTGRTCGRWSVCLEGALSPEEAHRGVHQIEDHKENEHQGQHAAADKQPVQPFVFGLYHGFVEG